MNFTWSRTCWSRRERLWWWWWSESKQVFNLFPLLFTHEALLVGIQNILWLLVLSREEAEPFEVKVFSSYVRFLRTLPFPIYIPFLWVTPETKSSKSTCFYTFKNWEVSSGLFAIRFETRWVESSINQNKYFSCMNTPRKVLTLLFLERLPEDDNKDLSEFSSMAEIIHFRISYSSSFSSFQQTWNWRLQQIRLWSRFNDYRDHW